MESKVRSSTNAKSRTSLAFSSIQLQNGSIPLPLKSQSGSWQIAFKYYGSAAALDLPAFYLLKL